MKEISIISLFISLVISLIAISKLINLFKKIEELKNENLELRAKLDKAEADKAENIIDIVPGYKLLLSNWPLFSTSPKSSEKKNLK